MKSFTRPYGTECNHLETCIRPHEIIHKILGQMIPGHLGIRQIGQMDIWGKGICRQRGVVSAAWCSGSERRFYDDHDRKVNGSTPNLVSLLCPWIRCFTMIISAWWNLASSKLKKSEKNSTGKLGNKGNS